MSFLFCFLFGLRFFVGGVDGFLERLGCRGEFVFRGVGLFRVCGVGKEVGRVGGLLSYFVCL